MEALATVGLLRLQALKGHWLEWERREACWSELGRLLCLLAGGATHQALRRLALEPPTILFFDAAGHTPISHQGELVCVSDGFIFFSPSI